MIFGVEYYERDGRSSFLIKKWVEYSDNIKRARNWREGVGRGGDSGTGVTRRLYRTRAGFDGKFPGSDRFSLHGTDRGLLEWVKTRCDPFL
jgi:hypothetical protein